jgi:hypothetical protein
LPSGQGHPRRHRWPNAFALGAGARGPVTNHVRSDLVDGDVEAGLTRLDGDDNGHQSGDVGVQGGQELLS